MPGFRNSAFNCPRCGAYAQQNWFMLRRDDGPYTAAYMAICSRCSKEALWYRERQVWPHITAGPRPNEDLGEDIVGLYEEARSVASLSPRSAAALLRLSTEMLVRRLCEEGGIIYKDLNGGIAELVKKGLPITIQEALDILRVTGNEAVHPGQIDFEDNSGTVMSLFDFLNLIAHDRITQPRSVADHYATLDKAKRESINDRDATSSVGN